MLTKLINFAKKIFLKTVPKPELIKFEIIFKEPGFLLDSREEKLAVYRVKREISVLVRFLRLHLLISEEAMNEAMSSIKSDATSNIIHVKIPSRIKIKLLKEISENYSIQILP